MASKQLREFSFFISLGKGDHFALGTVLAPNKASVLDYIRADHSICPLWARSQINLIDSWSGYCNLHNMPARVKPIARLVEDRTSWV